MSLHENELKLEESKLTEKSFKNDFSSICSLNINAFHRIFAFEVDPSYLLKIYLCSKMTRTNKV